MLNFLKDNTIKKTTVGGIIAGAIIGYGIGFIKSKFGDDEERDYEPNLEEVELDEEDEVEEDNSEPEEECKNFTIDDSFEEDEKGE